MAQIVILGGGAAGLAAAWALTEKGCAEVLVLERAAEVGGLLGRVVKNGNIYEYGTHVFHTDNEELRQRVKQLMKGELLEFERAGKLHIKFRNQYFRYPLNGIDILRHLPLSLSIQCLLSLVYSLLTWRLFNGEPANSAEVLTKHFGRKLYHIFFKEYTHKFWGLPCEELDKAFALERIPRSDVFKIIHDLSEALGFGRMFSRHHLTERAIGRLYYCKGGIHEIPRKLSEVIVKNGGRVETNVRLQRVCVSGGKAEKLEYYVNSQRREVEVQSIISTIPIHCFAALFEPRPPTAVMEAANRLKYLPLIVCGLLVKRKPVREAICTYFRDRIFNRVSEPTNHGLTVVPENRSILLAEMTEYTLIREGLYSDEEITQRVIGDLVDENLIHWEEVEDSNVFRYQEAYPIYHVGFWKDLKQVQEYLDGVVNVRSTGRQGSFCYVNAHASMMMAMKATRELVQNRTP